MIYTSISELFAKHDNQFLKFDQVTGVDRLSERADLCAFLLLDRLVPGKHDMVSSAEHDEIYLDVLPEDLMAVVTESQLVTLIRCGLRYDDDSGSLAMYV